MDAIEVVDLVGDEADVASVEAGDAASAVGVLVLDVERQRARDHAADIEEAEAALVLLVAWGLFDDDGIDERDRVLAGHLDEGGGAADADLGAAMPTPLPKTWAASTRLMADESWATTRRAS